MSETLTVWEVYWVMQADKLLDITSVIAVILGLVLIPLSAAGIASFDKEFPKDIGKLVRRSWLAVMPLFAILLVFYAVVPSTKTVAAMIILPAIVNNETVHDEASELYQLAKDALEDMVRADDDSSDEGS